MFGISLHCYIQLAVLVAAVGYLVALTVYYFSIEVDVETWTISSQIRMCIYILQHSNYVYRLQVFFQWYTVLTLWGHCATYAHVQ